MVPRVPATSTVRPPETTRQAPCRSDSGNGEPPDRRARSRATARGSPSNTRAMTNPGRARSRSRTLPPTSHAPGTGARSRITSKESAVDDDMLDPPPARRDITHDLVADRVAEPRPFLRADPFRPVLPDQHHRIAGLDIAL